MNIQRREKKFASATGLGPIRYRMWVPEEVRAAVQITHGMAEHIDRYEELAMALAEEGILVYGQDHAGHGKSTPDSPRGYFGEKGGWDALIEDMHTLLGLVKAEFPGIPYVLLGHSMGSFLARTYCGRRGKDFDAYVFSGTAGKNPLLVFGKLIGRMQRRRHGAAFVSDLLNKLSFGAYNKQVGGTRTDFDWLSVNESNVDAYVADEACGFPFTVAGMLDLFDGLTEISRREWAPSTADRPMLLVSGEEDPVGGKKASGVLEVKQALEKAGRRVECCIYPGLRHEIFREDSKNDIYGDVRLFIETVAAEGERV